MKADISKIASMIKGNEYYNCEMFIFDAKAYIEAIENGTMIVDIVSVSNSGMSRRLKFLACQRNKRSKQHYYRQFNSFLNALGYKVNNDGNFIVYGCGMDMVFATNYDIMHALERLGIINKKQCDVLAQKTPSCI